MSVCKYKIKILLLFFFSFPSLLNSPLCLVSRQLVGRAVGKDPVNSLSVEGFVQKTVVTSPEVAHLSLFPFHYAVYYLKHFVVWCKALPAVRSYYSHVYVFKKILPNI